ncbi:MAG: hypothetical protein ACK4WH_01720 [Phycisphaerales bacterium]
MRENSGDIAALQAGLKQRKPARSGVRFYTADFDSMSLCDFYRGRSAFLMLSGPSLNQIDLAQLNRRGVVTMAVNNAWTLHRPTLWTCVDDPGRFIDTGWKDPGILKIVPVSHFDKRLRVQNPDGSFRASAFKVRQMPSVLFYRRSDHFDHSRFLKSDTINWGQDGEHTDSLGIKGKRSVMLAALHLLHYLGFRTVYLLGCDFKMAGDRKYAFREERTKEAIRHNNILYESLHKRFEALKPHFDQHGFKVINCSPGSELSVFERMEFADAIAAAGAECGKEVDTAGWYQAKEEAKK